jgi:rhodanese-related sulfurtransferase
MTALITRAELQVALDAGSVTVVDALPASYYAQAHLPGAINLVESDVEAEAPRLLPDRSAAIVTYCSNAACANSQNVAAKLERLGYTNVRKYRDGIQDWSEAGLPVLSSTPASHAASTDTTRSTP